MGSALITRHDQNHRERGLSLIELMVAVAIGLFILLALTALLASNSSTRNEMEKAGRKIENGRYAIELLADDIRHAGFYGEFGDTTSMPLPGSVPTDPCPPNLATTGLTTLQSNAYLFVQGYDAATAAPGTCTMPYLKTDSTPKSDILVIRRADNHSVVLPSTPADGIYLQANPQQVILDKVDAGSTTPFTLKQKSGSATPSVLRLYQTNVYYVGTCSDCGNDNIPTLRRREISGFGYTDVPLVEGIENIQIEYGLDDGDTNGDGNLDANDVANAAGDGSPDHYVTAATIAAYPAGGTANASPVAAWGKVVTIRLYVLARNTEISAGWDDSKNYYCLGGDANCGTAIKFTPPAGDHFKRQVYSLIVRLNNPSGRKEK